MRQNFRSRSPRRARVVSDGSSYLGDEWLEEWARRRLPAQAACRSARTGVRHGFKQPVLTRLAKLGGRTDVPTIPQCCHRALMNAFAPEAAHRRLVHQLDNSLLTTWIPHELLSWPCPEHPRRFQIAFGAHPEKRSASFGAVCTAAREVVSSGTSILC